MVRLLAAGFVTLALSVPALAAAELRRGVGLHTMMNWADTASAPDTYAWPPFAGPAHHVPDALLANIAASGFDFIRLTVDPGPFLTFTGHQRDALDDLLVGNIDRIARHGLAVVVDFHPNRQVPKFHPIALLEHETGPLFSAYVEMVGRTAALLGQIDGARVVLEPFNEPPYGYSAAEVARWQRMLGRLHKAARDAAPELKIIVSGARGGGIRGLTELDPEPLNDGKTLFSFHYYEPHAFTHQSVRSDTRSVRHLRYFVNVPYPTDTGSPEAIWDGIQLEIESDTDVTPSQRSEMRKIAREKLDTLFDEPFGPRNIAADFDRVVDWAKTHGIPAERIFLGEFGAVRTYGRYRAADPVSHTAWLRDVRRAAEERGFAWSFWSVRGYGGMVLVERDGSTDLHAATVRALGLRP